MKKLIVTIQFIVWAQFLFAQSHVQYRSCSSCDTHGQGNSTITYQYNGVEEYEAILVADDYGPRIDGDKWHGGVDYNSQADGEPGGGDRGDLIIAIENGRIRGQIDAGYKRLFVDGEHNFGYGHLFWGNQNNTQSGGCYLSRMLSPNQNRFSIVIVDDSDTSAIGTRVGNTIFSGDTLVVSDWIDAGDPIGPTGGSSDGNELGPHLHLYSNPDGNISINDEVPHNPLQYVAYEDTTFQVTILRQNDEDGGITITYPGTNEQTIQVRPKLNGQPTEAKRYHKVLDLDEVKYYIKPKNDNDYLLIEGPTFESRLCLGGRIGGTERYPRLADAPYPNPSPFYNTESQWGRTGIHPYAYRGDYENGVRKADPWDDYYYADFITRIHQDDDPTEANTPTRIADTPDKARYNDGTYQLKAIVTDVRGNEHEGPTDDNGNMVPIEFTLDNFKPYVTTTVVRFGFNTLYESRHESVDPNTTLANNGYVQIGAEQEAIPVTNGQELNIYFVSSEPMDVATVMFSNPNLASTPIPWTWHSPDLKTFRFNLGVHSLTEEKCYDLTFHGQDLSGNDLLDIKEMADANGQIIVPKRQNTLNDNITWSPAGFVDGGDTGHTFCYGLGCSPLGEDDECLELSDFHYTIENGTVNSTMSVNVDIKGGMGLLKCSVPKKSDSNLRQKTPLNLLL